MKALTLTLTLACAALALSGCRKAHLGPDTGEALREALDAHANSRAKAPKMSADDALQTVDVHYNGPNGSGAGQLSSPMPSSMSYSGMGSGASSGSGRVDPSMAS